MKLEVNLDRAWEDEYGEHISTLIEREIDICIKAEVKKVIASIVKERVDTLREHIAKQMRDLPSSKLDAYLTRISREGL